MNYRVGYCTSGYTQILTQLGSIPLTYSGTENVNTAFSYEQETPSIAIHRQLNGLSEFLVVCYTEKVLLKESKKWSKTDRERIRKDAGMEELKLKLKFESKRCMADLQCLRNYV